MVIGAVGLLLGGVLGEGLLVTSVLMPGLLVQDSWRLAFFAAGRGRAAFLNDLVWAVVMFPGLALALLVWRSDVAGLILVWGISAAAAAIVGILQSGVLPRPDHGGGWLREHRALSGPLTAESVVNVGSQQLASLGWPPWPAWASSGRCGPGSCCWAPCSSSSRAPN